jgi:predicted amidohydrolase
MQDISITLIQTSLHWEDRPGNLEKFTRLLSRIEGHTDLIVLPEMFTTGFSMNAQALAETAEGATMSWLKEKASGLGCVITGSLIFAEGGRFFNRLIWMRPDGSYDHYDKRHLFRMAGEHEHFAAGSRRLVTDLNGWRFCPLICYDLRFPVWSRSRGDYDALVFIANWPEPRSLAWKSLLPARAIENQAYAIGVNRIGTDGNERSYSGDSGAYDPSGVLLSQIRPHEESIETVILSGGMLVDYREEFQVALDADSFNID